MAASAVLSCDTSLHRARCALTVKVDPLPSSLTHSMPPPMASAKRRLMTRPRPVPPKRAEIFFACENDFHRHAQSSASIPMPVSCTAKEKNRMSVAAVTQWGERIGLRRMQAH